MKKLISILCAAAMLTSAAAMPAAAEEEFETEIFTSLEGYYFIQSISGQDVEIEDAKEIVTDTVDGVERPVIRVTLRTGSNRDFGVNFDDVPDGDYRLTAKYYCPVDPGEGRFGLRRENGVNWAGNSPTGAIKQNETYETVVKNITISDNGNNQYQYARIRFNGGDSGGNGYCYIAEFKLQKVSKDENGNEILGENILPEFYTERIKGTIDGWQLTNSDDAMEIAYAAVNGINKPVIKWSYHQTGGSHLRYYLGGHNAEEKNLPEGDYRISVTYYAPKNPGTGRIGIRNDSNGGFPGNNSTKSIIQNSEYETVTRDVTVGEASSYAKQYLDIACESGESSDIYIAEVKLQKINGEDLGDNLIENGDFMVRKTSSEPEKPDDPDPDEPSQIKASNLMFDVVDDNGQSLMQGNTLDAFPYLYMLPDEAGDYPLSASVNVKNNGGETINPVLIVAIYNSGLLCDVQFVKTQIEAGENKDMYVHMSIPDISSNLEAKAFLWEGFGEMKPVIPCLKID